MITFKQFLSEENVYDLTAVSVDQSVAWLKTHASKTLASFKQSDNWFYRGAEYSEFFGIIDSTKFNRVSANTLNTYTIWIDNNPMWAEFPKRSKGLVCSTSRSVAGGYSGRGGAYLVIPADTAKVGVVGASDFWHSFPEIKNLGRGLYDLDDFVRMINRFARAFYFSVGGELMEKAKVILDDLSTKSANVKYEDLVWLLKNVTAKEFSKQSFNHPHLFDDWLEFGAIFATKYTDLYDLFSDIISPQKSKLAAALAPTAIKMADANNEVWISGQCFVIDEDTLDSLRDADSAIDAELYSLIRRK